MSTPPIPEARELKQLCAARGIRPSRGLGQNFMVDSRALHFLVDAAEVGPADVILEPGPGPGGLTGLLAERAAQVVAVELDRKLHALVSERLGQLTNLCTLCADIIDNGAVSIAALAAVEHAMAETPHARFKVVANLPYCISTALLDLLITCEPLPDVVVVTVQKEVADRICAGPGSKEYGFLSVLMQAVARPERLRILRPDIFWPQPAVDSAVVRIRPDRVRREAAGDLQRLRRLVSGLFTHRRKQTARAMVMAGLAPDRPAAETMLARAGIEPALRPEAVPLSKMLALAQLVS